MLSNCIPLCKGWCNNKLASDACCALPNMGSSFVPDEDGRGNSDATKNKENWKIKIKYVEGSI